MCEYYRRKGDRGFSLVELAILLGMTTILAAISVPMLNSAMRDMQLTADAKSIATTMTYARVSAASQLTRYQMSFDVANNQWTLSKWNRTTSAYEVQQATNRLSNGITNSGIKFQAGSGTAPEAGLSTQSSATITFDSRGIPMEGSGVIYLSSRDINFAISVSPAGKVQLWRNQNSQWNKK